MTRSRSPETCNPSAESAAVADEICAVPPVPVVLIAVLSGLLVLPRFSLRCEVSLAVLLK